MSSRLFILKRTYKKGSVMRVLHFYSTYYPDTVGGAEAAISQICQATKAFDVSSTVLALSKSPYPRELNLHSQKVVRCKTSFEIASTRFSFSALKALQALSKEHDIIHYHFPWPFADLCQILLFLKTPYIVTYHSDVVKQRFLLKAYTPLMNLFLDGASKIVATSPNYLASSDVLQKYERKVTVIPLAISPESYLPADTALIARWRSKLGDAPFFLFVGVLRYYKGLHLLIEAARGSDLRVVIAGDGPEGDALIRQANGVENVIFLGRISEPDKIALLTLAYGFVFPSHLRSEAFGMALLEAALFGLPSVCFEIGTGTSFVVVDGVSGIVAGKVDVQNPTEACLALRNAMLLLLSDKEMASRLGKAAKSQLASRFNVRLLAKAYTEVYTDATKQPH
jgi:O-antigen biosynthesis rhamnosyltransferase